ncbi:interferon-induced very large GTPase 1-like [Artemia franciscana]|uniref:interferon-induced very large GTPase 1-like n=1 Tax=Artemia franciscana TaxID=6661 RepID=UPI0032DBE2F9
MSDLRSFGREATTLLQESPINRSSAADFLNRFSGNVELLSGSQFTPQDVLSNMSEDEIRQMLKDVVSELKETSSIIDAQNSPTDSSFISRLSSGLARYGVLYGADDSNLLLKAKAPLLRTPEEIELLGSSKPIVSRTIYSSSVEQSKDEVNRFIDTGWAIGGSVNLSLFSAGIKFVDKSYKSDCSSSNTKLESIVFHKLGIYPVGAFRIPSNQINLSSETEDALKRIETITEAEGFLQTFGSHYPSDIHHYGGIVHFLCEITAKESSSVSELAKKAEKEFAASLFCQGLGIGFKASASCQRKIENQQKQQNNEMQSTKDIHLIVYGPRAARSIPSLYEIIKKTPEEGIIIDRGELKYLIPVWTLLGNEFQHKAELIKNAWMNITKDTKSIEIQNLHFHYRAIGCEEAKKNMQPLAELRRQQKKKLSRRSSNSLKEETHNEVAKNIEETEEKSEIEAMTPFTSVEMDLSRQLRSKVPNRENIHTLLQQKFLEEDLVSAFTIDCPRDLNNISYRLLHRLELKYKNISTVKSKDSSDSEDDFYPKMKQTTKQKKYGISHLISMYSLRDKVSVLQLLLESRFAIPVFSKDTVELLRVTRRIEEDIFLGEDLNLPRIAVISQVKSFSFTGNILDRLFNLKTSFEDTEISGIEVGQGLVCLENNEGHSVNGDKYKKPCVVIHIRGDFDPYWKLFNDFIDYLVVEDIFTSESSNFSHFVSSYSHIQGLPRFNTVWIPSLRKAIVKNCHPFCLIEGSLDYFIEIQQNHQLGAVFRKATQTIHKHSMHSVFPLESSLEPDINTLRQMYMAVSKMDSLETYRSNVLILQKSFAKEGELTEKLNEFELVNDPGKRSEIQKKISKEKKFRLKNSIKKDSLINYFLKGLQKNDINHIILHLHVIDYAISVNIKESKIMGHLEQVVYQKTKNYLKSIQLPCKGPEYDNEVEFNRKELLSAKEKRNYALLSLRHLWREVSLFYSAGKCGDFEHLPYLAASCLIAGETLELYDGDANMLNVDWIGAIFNNLSSLLPQKRIFVLSVLGEQSSGKSTLLNTMFGISLTASIGQCTRGLTMTLVKTVNRKEYDYVLILDTEGVRSPEHKGSPGCAKRDNKIATLSILPSDAVILVIKGENDNALKDILPIVALAYKGSKLAEERGGMLSCKIFAAYNQVKCGQENRSKLLNIFTQLSATLVESFAKANSLEDLDVHTSVSFSQMFINEQDIRVFGSNTKGDPPSDIPNEEFSQQIIDFREYIHEQVVNQSGWSARKIESLDNYLFLVWECLKNSNFDLSFETVIDRHVYSEIEQTYQTLRKSYIITYEEQYDLIKDRCKKENSLNAEEPTTLRYIDEAVENLKVLMKPHTEKFEEEVNRILDQKKNQKFKTEYERKVEDTISRQTGQWRHKLEVFLRNQLLFDTKAGQYEKEMRDKIIGEFRKESLKDKTRKQLIEMFDTYFNIILRKAEEENPPLDVPYAVRKAYQKNHTIELLGVDLSSNKETNVGRNRPFLKRILKRSRKILDEIVKWSSQSEINEDKIEKAIAPIIASVTTGQKYYCDAAVDDVVGEVEKYLKRHGKKIDRDRRKKVHEFAYQLLVEIFLEIQEKWEQENSVYKRFLSMKEVMQGICLDVANGLDEVDLMASRFEDFFIRHTNKAFHKEVEEKVMVNLKKKCWPQYPKYVQGHMDLYLIEEVESKGIDEVLYQIQNTSSLKKLTTSRLIGFEIEAVIETLNWNNFKDNLENCLRNIYEMGSEDAKTGLKSFQLHELFKSLRIFESTYFTDELTREKNAFGWTELDKLSVHFDQRHINAMIETFSKSDGTLKISNIIDSVWVQLQDNIHFEAAFCTTCPKLCPLCESPCFLEVSHNGLHDTFHQPRGLVGWRTIETKKLSDTACNTAPLDNVFVLNHGTSKEERWKYSEFSKKFSNWMQPDRTKPVSGYREYLMRRYNKEIAIHYKVNPSDISEIAESLEVVTNTIKRKVDFHKDFRKKTD